jgi:hypothetical protein
MSIQDLGSLGELIAALATLATLIYLAIQIRQNTATVRGSTIQGVTQSQQLELKWGSEIADAFAKSFQSPESLDFRDIWQLNEWFFAAFAARQNEYVQYKRGLLDEDVWTASKNIIALLASMPLCRKWWTSLGQHAFVDEFCTIVEDAMSAENDIVDWKLGIEALMSSRNESG